MPILTFKNFIVSGLFIFAFILCAWSVIISRQGPVKDNFLNPDAYMEDIVAFIINSEGKLSLKIESPKLIHYPENDRTIIQKPHLTFYRHSTQPWYIDSDKGVTLEGATTVKLISNVVIHHPKDAKDPLTTMTTPSLLIYPDKKIAETKDPVTITQLDNIVDAVGMQANLDNGVVKLLSQARGRYVPN
jgi:lipopolysaccharide export system protein LptC